MPETINLDETDGWVEVQIGGVVNRLDLIAVHDRLVDLHEAHKDKTNDQYNQALVDLLGELGYPAVSRLVAIRFTQRVNELVQALKKKPETTPGSPASTGSTPGS